MQPACVPEAPDMPKVILTRSDFLGDRQGKTFADVVHHSSALLDEVLRFFNDADRQRRMEESEVHHDRAPLAGVVRELEALPALTQFFTTADPAKSKRMRQGIGVIVRMVMERRGWVTTGKKGSLGVRAARASRTAYHNTGGLAFWFIRAERYSRQGGMPYRSVKDHRKQLESERAPSSRRRLPGGVAPQRSHK
jgi:hypothetical protein